MASLGCERGKVEGLESRDYDSFIGLLRWADHFLHQIFIRGSIQCNQYLASRDVLVIMMSYTIIGQLALRFHLRNHRLVSCSVVVLVIQYATKAMETT